MSEKVTKADFDALVDKVKVIETVIEDHLVKIDRKNRYEAATKEIKKQLCVVCLNKGYTEKYYDAGDHFGASTSPFSEWVRTPCPYCRDKKLNID